MGEKYHIEVRLSNVEAGVADLIVTDRSVFYRSVAYVRSIETLDVIMFPDKHGSALIFETYIKDPDLTIEAVNSVNAPVDYMLLLAKAQALAVASGMFAMTSGDTNTLSANYLPDIYSEIVEEFSTVLHEHADELIDQYGDDATYFLQTATSYLNTLRSMKPFDVYAELREYIGQYFYDEVAQYMNSYNGSDVFELFDGLIEIRDDLTDLSNQILPELYYQVRNILLGILRDMSNREYISTGYYPPVAEIIYYYIYGEEPNWEIPVLE